MESVHAPEHAGGLTCFDINQWPGERIYYICMVGAEAACTYLFPLLADRDAAVSMQRRGSEALLDTDQGDTHRLACQLNVIAQVD